MKNKTISRHVQVSRVMPFKLATRKDESKSRHDRQMSWIEVRKQQSYDNEATKAVKRRLPQMTKIASHEDRALSSEK
jgi:hypothetical protein